VLRRELSALGPVSVKIGQTLSQRPDILPEDVCEALKGLQTANTPFPDAEAFQVMAEDFRAAGPLAPGLPGGPDPLAPPLFAKLSATCIASASLGQVPVLQLYLFFSTHPRGVLRRVNPLRLVIGKKERHERKHTFLFIRIGWGCM
jgi:hypothetical protein